MFDIGTLSPQGARRIEAALMQAAYSDSDLVAEMVDSLDANIRAIGEALKTVAGEWASMRDSARLGAISVDVDITGNLIQAVSMIRKARRDGGSLYDLSRQVDLTVGDTPDPLTLDLLQVFYTGNYFTRAVGKERLVAQLRDYVNRAMATSNGADMFGESVGPSDIISALTQTGGSDGTQTTATEGQGQPTGSGAAGNNPAQGGAAREGSEQDRYGGGPDQRGAEGPEATGQPDRQGDQAGGQGVGEVQAVIRPDKSEGAEDFWATLTPAPKWHKRCVEALIERFKLALSWKARPRRSWQNRTVRSVSTPKTTSFAGFKSGRDKLLAQRQPSGNRCLTKLQIVAYGGEPAGQCLGQRSGGAVGALVRGGFAEVL